MSTSQRSNDSLAPVQNIRNTSAMGIKEANTTPILAQNEVKARRNSEQNENRHDVDQREINSINSMDQELQKMIRDFPVISVVLKKYLASHSKRRITEFLRRAGQSRHTGGREFLSTDPIINKAIQMNRMRFNQLDPFKIYQSERRMATKQTSQMTSQQKKEFYKKHPFEHFASEKGRENDLGAFIALQSSSEIPCPLCAPSKIFYSQNLKDILGHIKKKHPKTSFYGCNLCHELFQSKEKWQTHNEENKHLFLRAQKTKGIGCLDCGMVLMLSDDTEDKEVRRSLKKVAINHNGSQMIYFEFITNNSFQYNQATNWKGASSINEKNDFGQAKCPFPECKGMEFDRYFDFDLHIGNHLEKLGLRYWFAGFLKSITAKKRETKREVQELSKEEALEEDQPGIIDPQMENFNLHNTVSHKFSFNYHFPKQCDSPGVLQNSIRVMSCQRCNALCIGLMSSFTHANECIGGDLSYFDIFVPVEHDGIMQQIAPPNRIPNDPIVCPRCTHLCCSLQGYIIHSASVHSVVHHVAKNSLEQFLSTERNVQFNLYNTPFVTAVINQNCGLTYDGQLKVDSKESSNAYMLINEKDLAYFEDGGDLYGRFKRTEEFSQAVSMKDKLEPELKNNKLWKEFMQGRIKKMEKKIERRANSLERNALEPDSSRIQVPIPKITIRRANSTAAAEIKRSDSDLMPPPATPTVNEGLIDMARRDREEKEKKRQARKEKKAAKAEKRLQVILQRQRDAEKQFEERKKKTHELKAVDFKLNCFECGLPLEDKTVLLKHMMLHRNIWDYATQKPNISCIHCEEFRNIPFASFEEYFKHTVEKHYRGKNGDSEVPLCQFCERSFESNEVFIAHLRHDCNFTNKCLICGEDQKGWKSAEKVRHFNSNHREINRFLCKCGEYFATLYSYDLHVCNDGKGGRKRLRALVNMPQVLLLGTGYASSEAQEPGTSVSTSGLMEIREEPASVEEEITESQKMEAEPPRKQRKTNTSETTTEGDPATNLLGNFEVEKTTTVEAQPVDLDVAPPSVMIIEPNLLQTSDVSSVPDNNSLIELNADIQPPPSVICLADESQQTSSSVGSSQFITSPPDQTQKEVDNVYEEDDDIFVLDQPNTSRVNAEKIVNEETEDEIEIIVRNKDSGKGDNRIAKFKCTVCTSGAFKTKSGLEEHMKTHSKDISAYDPLFKEVYGIPINDICYVCLGCSAAFEDKQRHINHMKIHLEITQAITLCEYCSGATMTQDMMTKHIGVHGHGFVTSENHKQIPIASEYWCTACDPIKIFLTDAGYFLHIMDFHKIPLLFFCKNCLIGCVNPDPIWQHIRSGICVDPRNPLEKNIGFVVATDIHYQPVDEKKLLTLSKANYIRPNECPSRTSLRFSNRFVSCMEKNQMGEKCLSLTNYFQFENYFIAKHNLYREAQGGLRNDQLPRRVFINSLNYNMYLWLMTKYLGGEIPREQVYNTKPSVFQPPFKEIFPNPVEPVGKARTTSGRRNQPRTPQPPATISVQQITPPPPQAPIDPRRASPQNAERQRLYFQYQQMNKQTLLAKKEELLTKRDDFRAFLNQNPDREAVSHLAAVEMELNICDSVLRLTTPNNMQQITSIPNRLRMTAPQIVQAAQANVAVYVPNQAVPPQGTSYRVVSVSAAQMQPQQVGIMVPAGQTHQQPRQAPIKAQLMQAPQEVRQQMTTIFQQGQALANFQQNPSQAIVQQVPIQQQQRIPAPLNIQLPVMDPPMQQLLPQANAPETDDRFTHCSICTRRRPTQLMIKILSKKGMDKFIAAVLSTSGDDLANNLKEQISKYLKVRPLICFDHVNPFGVSLVKTGASKGQSRQEDFVLIDPNYIVFNYSHFAQHSLEKETYDEILDQAMILFHKGELEKFQFLSRLKSANHCRYKDCDNTSLSSLAAARLHSFHVDRHPQSNMEQNHLCAICWCTFRDEREMIFHLLEHVFLCNIQIHSQVYDLCCPVQDCEGIFDTCDSLRDHLYQVHELRIALNELACCSQIFKTDLAKEMHRKEHEKPNASRGCCMLCGQTELFSEIDSTSFNVRRISHETVHAFDSTYACGLCFEGFAAHCELIYHFREFHMDKLRCTACNIGLEESSIAQHVAHCHEKRLLSINCTDGILRIKTPADMKYHLGLKIPQ